MENEVNLNFNGAEFLCTWEKDELGQHFLSIPGHGAHSIVGMVKSVETAYIIAEIALRGSGLLFSHTFEVIGNSHNFEALTREMRDFFSGSPLKNPKKIRNWYYGQELIGTAAGVLDAAGKLKGDVIVSFELNIIGDGADAQSFLYLKNKLSKHLQSKGLPHEVNLRVAEGRKDTHVTNH